MKEVRRGGRCKGKSELVTAGKELVEDLKSEYLKEIKQFSRKILYLSV